MKNQALFSSKDNSKKIKYRLLQFLLGTLRVNFKRWRVVVSGNATQRFSVLPPFFM